MTSLTGCNRGVTDPAIKIPINVSIKNKRYQKFPIVKKLFVIHGSRVCCVGELQVGCVDKCSLWSSLLSAPHFETFGCTIYSSCNQKCSSVSFIFAMLFSVVRIIWYDTIRYDKIRYDTIRCDTIRYDTIRYDMIWYDMIWYDIWYDRIWLIWYDMI